VMAVRRTADQKEVILDAQIDAKNPPPGNVVGHIRTQIVGGGGSVSLELPPLEPPMGKLEAHAQIPSTFLGTDLLPAEFGELAVELRVLTRELREAKVVEHFDETLFAVRSQLEKAGKLIDSLDQTVGDPKLRDDLRASLANFHTATDSATKIGANLEKFSANLDSLGQKFGAVADNANSTITKTQAHVDELSKRIDDRLLEVAKVLESFQSVAAKIDQGKGTAGLLVNDAKLYESLVDSSRELTLTIKDLKLLVEQWTEEGVHLKLK
jgi:ABC-type transporter Mla subunit MlaD